MSASRAHKVWNSAKAPAGRAIILAVIVATLLGATAGYAKGHLASVQGIGWNMGKGVDPEHSFPDFPEREAIVFKIEYFPVNYEHGDWISGETDSLAKAIEVDKNTTLLREALDYSLGANAGLYNTWLFEGTVLGFSFGLCGAMALKYGTSIGAKSALKETQEN